MLNKDQLLKQAIQHFSRDTPPISDIDLNSEVHNAKSCEAADINNEGSAAQLEYLIEYHGAWWVEELLKKEGVL